MNEEGEGWVFFGQHPEIRKKIRKWLLDRELRWRGLKRTLLRAVLVVLLTIREFHRSFCFERAATLSFVSILSMIPAVVLFGSFAGTLGGGDKIKEWFDETVMPKVAPEFQQQLTSWFDNNISQDAFEASSTGVVNALGVFGLVSAALLLMTVAERVFNRVWHVHSRRTWLQRLTAFWVILTTSPLLIAGSIAIEQMWFASSTPFGRALESSAWLYALFQVCLPLLIAFLGLTILFWRLPATHVRWTSAMLGALVTALLWQLTKSGFFLYVQQSASVSSFYGQLAAIPLFLIWIYVNWLLLLVGANLAFAHQNLIGLLGPERAGADTERRSRMFLGLELLFRRREVFAGRARDATLDDEAGELAVPSEDLVEIAARLAKLGYLIEDHEKPARYVLARAPELIAIRDVAEALLDEQFPGERKAGSETRPGPASESAALAWRGYLDALSGRKLSDADPRLPIPPGLSR